MHPLLLIAVVVLTALFALAWHDQPARDDRQTDGPASKDQPGV